MHSDYKAKLEAANLRSLAHKRSMQCLEFINRWAIMYCRDVSIFESPEKTFEKYTKLRKLDIGIGRRRSHQTLEIMTRVHEKLWQGEAFWKTRLETSRIPFLDRSEVSSDALDHLEPIGLLADLMLWIKTAPGNDVAELRNRVLLSLVMFERYSMELEEQKFNQGGPSISGMPDLQPSGKESFSGKTLKVFCSYSHKDESFRTELEKHLAILKRSNRICIWTFRRILPGANFDQVIDEKLESADIVFILVSADFLSSDYCYEIEMKRALEKHHRGETRLIPILVRQCNWGKAPFSKLQMLPQGAKPVAEWSSGDDAWTNVSYGVESVVDSLSGC